MPKRASDSDNRTLLQRRPVTLLLAGGLAALLLIGCCLCGGAYWMVRPRLQNDPALARHMLSEIVDIQPPGDFHPQGSIDWNIPFVMQLRGVYLEREIGDGMLSFVSVNSRFGAYDSVRRHMRKTLLEEGSGGTQLIVDESQTVRELIPINGKQAPFTFQVAKDGASSRVYHVVEGTFEGKQGQVLLTLRVDQERWNDATRESILTMLHSIGRP